MKTLALQNGDLIAGPNGHETVSGAKKISTELSLAMGENYGNDRFHPTWGSTLSSYIGRPVDGTTQLMVKSEVNRVLQNYIAVQLAEVVNDANSPGRSKYSTADVISNVTNLAATVSFDTIYIRLVLRTLANETVTLNKAVNL